MAMALLDRPFPVGPGGIAPLGEHHGIETEAHGPALVRDVSLLGQEIDHVVGRPRSELRGVRPREAAHVTGVLDHRALHAEADAEVRHVPLSRVADGLDLPLDAAITEAAGHPDAIEPLNVAGEPPAPKRLRAKPDKVNRNLVADAAVGRGLVEALVGFLPFDD